MPKSLQHKALLSPKTILYLADNEELKSALGKCAKDINYDFIDKKKPLLVTDFFCHFIILDRRIMTEEDWKAFVNVSNHCDLGNDVRHCLLILINSTMNTLFPALKRRPVVSLDIEDNSSTKIILEHIINRYKKG